MKHCKFQNKDIICTQAECKINKETCGQCIDTRINHYRDMLGHKGLTSLTILVVVITLGLFIYCLIDKRYWSAAMFFLLSNMNFISGINLYRTGKEINKKIDNLKDLSNHII